MKQLKNFQSKMKKKKIYLLLLVVLLFAMFASVFTIQKETLNHSEQFFLIGSRMLFAGIVLLLYETMIFKRKILIKLKHFSLFIVLSVCNVYLTNIFEIWGLGRMLSSKACLMYSLSPFLTALLAYVSINEILTKKKALGMLLGFSGLIPIIYMQNVNEIKNGVFWVFSLAELSMILAVVFNIYGWISLKKILELDYSLIMSNGISMLIGGILTLFHSYFSGECWNPLPVTDMKMFIFYTILTCLISNILAYNIFGFLLKYFTVTFMSFAGLITPLFALLFGWIFLNENITIYFFISIFLFLVGLVIFYNEEFNVSLDINK